VSAVSAILLIGATVRMFLLKEHIGLPVVTSTAETSTRRNFKSAWKGYPPELRVRKHAPLLHLKNVPQVRFLSGLILIVQVHLYNVFKANLLELH